MRLFLHCLLCSLVLAEIYQSSGVPFRGTPEPTTDKLWSIGLCRNPTTARSFKETTGYPHPVTKQLPSSRKVSCCDDPLCRWRRIFCNAATIMSVSTRRPFTSHPYTRSTSMSTRKPSTSRPYTRNTKGLFKPTPTAWVTDAYTRIPVRKTTVEDRQTAAKLPVVIEW